MIRLLLVTLIASCSMSEPTLPAASLVTPASCGTPCTNSSQCSDIFSSCRYCGNQGKCTSGLIASPPEDAGIDASSGTAP
jgi:hypothetical protein